MSSGPRPKVERKIGHLMRRKHGGRRARVRGRTNINANFSLLAAAVKIAPFGVQNQPDHRFPSGTGPGMTTREKGLPGRYGAGHCPAGSEVPTADPKMTADTKIRQKPTASRRPKIAPIQQRRRTNGRLTPATLGLSSHGWPFLSRSFGRQSTERTWEGFLKRHRRAANQAVMNGYFSLKVAIRGHSMHVIIRRNPHEMFDVVCMTLPAAIRTQ